MSEVRAVAVSAERAGARAMRQLYVPRRVDVNVGPDGRPRAVEGSPVEAVREEWVVEDRWWAPRPLCRHYYELVLGDGRDLTVFRSRDGRWHRQRA